MKKCILLILMLFYVLSEPVAQDKVSSTSLILPQIQVVPIQDTQADRWYELYIELPEGYADNTDKRYPVLYYTDAMWHMEVLSASAEYILTEAILVGISWQTDNQEDLLEQHGPSVSRYRDYTIAESNNPERQAKYQFGKAGDHVTFIREDVIPFIEDRYRTDPESRAYFGYSAGGLFGAYTLITKPDTFTHYILGSPSLNGDIPVLTQTASKLDQAIYAHVFISYGTLEEELKGFGDQFMQLLKARNEPQLYLHHVMIKGTHQTAFPGTGVQSMSWLAELFK